MWGGIWHGISVNKLTSIHARKLWHGHQFYIDLPLRHFPFLSRFSNAATPDYRLEQPMTKYLKLFSHIFRQLFPIGIRGQPFLGGVTRRGYAQCANEFVDSTLNTRLDRIINRGKHVSTRDTKGAGEKAKNEGWMQNLQVSADLLILYRLHQGRTKDITPHLHIRLD